LEIIRTISWMKEQARQARAESRIIGLVPDDGRAACWTPGAGERAKRECSPVIASIFLNPKQFGPKEDLAKYPRAFTADSEKFASAGVDSLFAPEPRKCIRAISALTSMSMV